MPNIYRTAFATRRQRAFLRQTFAMKLFAAVVDFFLFTDD